jgi:hypothetical protein
MPVVIALPFRKRKISSDETRNVVVWGWFRLFLGLTQMMMASAAILSFFARGMVWQTCVLAGLGLGTSILSRWLYRGR